MSPGGVGVRLGVGVRVSVAVRVGDYRVLYEVDDTAHRVRIMRVRHRREAYR